MQLEDAIAGRRSIREFKAQPLSSEQIAKLCWAAQGITDPEDGGRAAPSAGGLFPIELYIVTADGVDHYLPEDDKLARCLTGDVLPALQRASLGQECVGGAPVCMVIAAVQKRLARKYGRRSERYCFLEAGHLAQNIHLQATALGLGSVAVGAFEDDDVARVLELPEDQRVLYMVPVGHPRG
jgi:SagB-type dehydrogenase family enzyme